MGVFLAALALASCCGWLIPAHPASSYLYADGGNPDVGLDSDQEGLVDSVEAQIGSSPLLPDTDSDGASDLIEMVYGTNPLSAQSFPQTMQYQSPKATITSYVDGDSFHIVVSVAVPDGTLASISQAGALLFAPQIVGLDGPQVLDLNPIILSGAIQYQPVGGNSTAAIYSSDSSFPKDVLSLFMGSDGYVQFSIAFSAVVGGVLVGDVALFTTAAIWDFTSSSISYMQITPQSPGTGTFKPLEPVSLPPNWNPDSACYITSSIVGVDGVVLILQATDANCEPQAGTVCNVAACGEFVGRIFRLVDPCALGVCQ
jgi:hypothetical protein